ncbi:hypothetical protein FGO68_gene16141 [Halteria grandinella]|uniref:Uncharacterized protein n=1 Tax=Halteria grandinella TaxID=5974 RepID=A0A8J8NVR3_HALGN|nr:hypothetical protein FGO68_gene16141 [Halteria grandinella]
MLTYLKRCQGMIEICKRGNIISSHQFKNLGDCELFCRKTISKPYQELIQLLLDKDPQKRPNMKEVLMHPLIKQQIVTVIQKMSNQDQIRVIRDQVQSQYSSLEYSLKNSSMGPLEQSEAAINMVEPQDIKQDESKEEEDAELVSQSQNYDQQLQPQDELTQYENFSKIYYHFVERELDQFLQLIRNNGHAKLAEAALLHGLQISRLNKMSHKDKIIKHLVFEGVVGDRLSLNKGIYWGQCEGEVRDGYGLVYCISYNNNPRLFECQWDRGRPVNGRVILIVDNEWQKYEGAFDHEYLRTGTGNIQGEDGELYEGEWNRAEMHGRGKSVGADGRSYEGEFKDNKSHGQGRYTLPDGTYLEGQWEDDKQIGVHMQFNKDGRLMALLTYKGGQLVNVEDIE